MEKGLEQDGVEKESLITMYQEKNVTAYRKPKFEEIFKSFFSSLSPSYSSTPSLLLLSFFSSFLFFFLYFPLSGLCLVKIIYMCLLFMGKGFGEVSLIILEEFGVIIWSN